MSWMDFKTAQAMTDNNSKFSEAQKLNESSKKSNTGIQKGTGEKPTQTLNSVSMKTALAAPKGNTVKGIHKADAKVAPATSGDFSYNQSGGDQSTENNPEASGIQYESHNADQSTENNPEDSSIQYESYNADQSTENNPDNSGVQYESYPADQSTENNPDQQYEQQY